MILDREILNQGTHNYLDSIRLSVVNSGEEYVINIKSEKEQDCFFSFSESFSSSIDRTNIYDLLTDNQFVLEQQWVKDMYAESKDDDEPEKLSIYFDELYDLLSANRYDEYGYVMQNLPLSDTNETIIIGLLRMASMHKDVIAEWDIIPQEKQTTFSKV